MTATAAPLPRPALTTERLRLRRPDAGDVAAVARIAGDWEVARHLARVPHPYGPDDALFFLEQVVPREWVWAITIAGAAELVGVVGLTPTEDIGTADLGYWLDRAHWRRGIVTEAASAVVAYGFEVLQLAVIAACYFDGNPASGRVLQKLGFGETGRAMQPCLAVGPDVPVVEMCLSRGPISR